MSFTHSTSAHALRRVAIFAAVLVMSMVNVSDAWANYAYLDPSGATWWYNDGAAFTVSLNSTDFCDYVEVNGGGTGVWRFNIGNNTGTAYFKRRHKDACNGNWNQVSGTIDETSNVMSVGNGSMQTSFVINYIHGTNHVYFDNSVSNFPNNIYLVIGHDYSPTGASSTYTKAYKMSPVVGTKLYHVEISATWEDANYYAIIADDAASISATDWGSSSIGTTDKGDKGYTAAYKTVYNMEGGSYMITTAAAGNGKAMTITYYDGHSNLPKVDASQAAKKRDTGTTYSDVSGSWPATLKLQGSYMNNATDTARSTISSTASTDEAADKTYDAIKTGTVTHSYTSLSSSYYFEGWGTSSTPSVTTATHSYNITAATTMYAFFSKLYALTYDAKGTKGSSSVSAAAANYGDISSGDDVPTGHSITVTASPATGYRVEGWYSDASCETAYTSGSGGVTISGDGNTVFTLSSLNANSGVYCKFEYITYSVVFDNNGGSGSMDSQDFTYNTAQNLTPNAFTKSGYSFVGWANSTAHRDAGTVDYTEEESVSNLTTTNGATVTLYAVWQESDYIYSMTETSSSSGARELNEIIKTSLKGGVMYNAIYDASIGVKYFYDNAGMTGLWFSNDPTKCKVKVVLAQEINEGSIFTVRVQNPSGDRNRGVVIYSDDGTVIKTLEKTKEGVVYFIYEVQSTDTKLIGSNTFYVSSNGQVTLIRDLTVTNLGDDKPYTIDLDDGSATTSVSPSSLTITSGSSTLSSSITNPGLTGYTFSGWYSGSGGTGDLVINTSGALQANTCYTGAGGIWAAGNVTLYAKWTANVYTVEEHNDGGRIWGDSIENYTYGEGATLPTCVTKWGCDFDGWYEDNKFTEGPVTTIGTSETGNKDYYAKWTEIAQNYPIASHPEFLAAQEGDIIAVTVTGVHNCAAIYLYDLNSTEITHFDLSATGTYTIQLSAAAATGIRTYGLQVTGNNFTFSDVDIRYRKTLWTGTLSDNKGWAELAVDKTIFSGMSGGDFLGFNITAINDGESWHQYAMRADYDAVLSGSCTATGIGIHKLSAADVVALRDSDRIDITAQYLDISNLYSYTHTRVYTVTLNTNGGTINAGDVTNYTFGTGATLPTNVTKTGYTFAGWYDNSGLTGSAVTTITTSDYGNKEYWAKWTANNYTVTLNTNSGTINTGDVTSYTYGVGATLPTDVTRNDYTFDGWFDNSGLTGDAVTEIADDATGNKEYWAKWTDIKQEFSKKGSLPIKIVGEGDLVVVDVSAYGASASIVLKDKTGTTFASQSISATGRYAFPLTSAQASTLHDSLIVTGTNYTGDVSILFRKTIWTGTLSDIEGWTGSDQIASSLFSDMEEGEFVGIKVSAINGDGGWYKCGLYAGNYSVFVKEVSATGTYIGEVTAAGVDSLQNKWVGLGAQFLDISTLYTYVANKYYSITYKECDNSTVIEGLEPTTYAYGVDSELPTPTKSGYTFDAWYNKYCVIDEEHGWIDGCQKTSTGTSMYGSVTYLAKWHQTVTLNMQGVCSNLTPTIEYLGTELLDYSTGTTTFRDDVLKGYYTAASDGTKVLNADGTFAASSVTDYITDGKWTKEGATTLYAQWDATIDLPDTLDVSNYVAYGGGLTLKGDSLDYTTGTSSKRDGWAEWKVNVGKYVYNVTTLAHFSSGHQWKIYLINGSDTISSCAFDKKYIGAGVEYSETKSWDLSEITSAGTYTLQVKNVMANGEPKLLYVAMDPITVTYDANGGSCATETAIYAGSAMTLPSATKSGYVFEGWYSGGTKIGNAGGSYEPTASITLIAKWGIITALPDTLTKENVGDYSSDMTWYGDDDEYFDFGPTDAANLGRWAKWEVDVVPCTYNVTIAGYYPNSHKWQLVLTNGTTVHDTLKVSSSDVDEWDLTGIAKGTYTLELKNIYEWSRPKIKSLVLSPDLYTITYDAGEYGSGSIAAGKKIGCHNFTLSSSTFTRAGYEQDGWATSDGGSKAYNLGATYSTDAALTLYPHWTCATPPDPTAFTAGSITDGGVTFTITDDADAASYEIYYSTDDDEPDGETEATTTADSKTKEVTGLTAGTTYYAWVRAVCDGSHKSAWVALTGSTFFTNYSITMGTVTTRQHDGSTVGGTISASPSSAAASTSVTLTATPTSGYVFVAWQIVDGSSADKTKDLLGADSTLTTPTFTMPAYSVTVNATFARQYTITYKEEDKTTLIDGLDPTTYIYGVGATLPTPERTGYTFDAWYKWTCVDGGSGFADGCKRTAIDNDAYGDYIFYGKFTPNNYTVTLDNQSATSAGTESISVTYDDDANLTDEPAITSPTKTCYAFGGYYTETAGGGSQIIDADGNVNASVDGYTDESKNWIYAGNVTLYAKWTQVNLALNKDAYVYKYAGTDYASNVNDGNLNNLWKLAEPIPEGAIRDSVWWYVDLDGEYVLQYVDLFWEGAYATHFIMQTRKNAPSSDDENNDDAWETFLNYTGEQTAGTTESDVNKYGDVDGAKAAFTHLPKGRYVRIRMLDAVNWAWGIKLRELRVYGTSALPDDDVAPVITSASYNGVTGDKKGLKFNVAATDDSGYDVKNYIVKDTSGKKHYVRESDGVITVTGMPTIKNQTVNIYAVDSAANISTAYQVSSVSYVNPDENIALNKDAYACVNYNADEGKAKANDGSTDTHWTSYTSGGKTNEWWYVDLGYFFTIDSIDVVWKANYNSTNYSVQYRQNAPADDSGATSSEWDAITEFTDVTSGNKCAHLASSIGAQYLCVRSKDRDATDVKLSEIRVYAKTFGTPDVTAPAWTEEDCDITGASGSTITMTLAATDANPEHVYDFVITLDNGTTTKNYERSTTALSNAITITDAEFIETCQIYTITATCHDHVGNDTTIEFTNVRPAVVAHTNIARGKTTVAGITEGGGDGSANAVDGNTGTTWSGNASGRADGVNQWMYVNLDAKYSIDSIKIMWGSDSGTWPQDYEIQVSYDGTNFVPIAHYNEKDGNRTNKYTFTDVSAQYVRVWANKAGTSYGMQITELEVYGDCYDDTEKPVMLFAEVTGAYVTAADFYMGAIHESIDSDELLYHLDITDNTDDTYSTTATITAGEVSNGRFRLTGLQDGDSYTINIYAAKISDESGNRSDNYRTVNFTTLELDTYTEFYFPGSVNGWLGVNSGSWTDEMDAWRFKTTAANGIYKMSHSVSTTATWTASFVYNKELTTRTYGDHMFSVTSGKDFIITMKGLESYVSNANTIYIAGDAVGTDDDECVASNALTWVDGTTAEWQGAVASGETFKLIFPDPYNDHEDNIRTDVLTPTAVTYSGSARYAKLTFDLETWEYEWTNADTYYFDGNEGASTAWNTAANWLNGSVPSASEDVVLLAPAEIATGVTAAAKSVVIATGESFTPAGGSAITATGHLTIAAGAALVVEGNVKRCADASDLSTLTVTRPEDLKIESSIDDGNGTLIFTNTGDSATVELCSKATTAGANWTWQYIGIPFETTSPVSSFYDGYLYEWPVGADTWQSVTRNSTLTAFTGYSVSYPEANHKFEMKGKLAPTTDQTIDIHAGKYMVIGNSWTAPIYVKGFTSDDFGSIYTKSVYLFNTGSHTSGAETWAGSGTRYNAGTYVAIPINAAGITGDSLIAPLQGFYVDNTTGSATTFTMNYDNLVRPDGNRNVVAGQMHAPRRAEAEEQPVVLKMWASGTNYDDRLILIEREDFTTEYDAGWDGEKWDAPGKQPMLYTTRPDGTTDAVSAIPELDGTVISFRAGEDSEYTLRFEYAEDNEELYIYDVEKNEYAQIVSGTTYPFTDTNTEAHNRFLLTRSKAPQITTGEKPTSDSSLKGRATKLILEQKLYIYRNGILYDATGRRVDSFSVGSGFDANANANANAEQEKGGAE